MMMISKSTIGELIEWLIEKIFKGAIVSASGEPEESAAHLKLGATCVWGKPIPKGAVEKALSFFASELWHCTTPDDVPAPPALKILQK
jgi:hypothetical protein